MKGMGLVLLIVLLSALLYFKGAIQSSQDTLIDSQDSMDDVLSSEQVDKFVRVLGPRKFVFPQDHGPHPVFRPEWWNFSGNLHDQNQRDYGYELTFFR